MSAISRSLLASAALLLSSSPLFAQSLAQEVVEEYFSEIRDLGMDINIGATSIVGDTVKWNDIVISFPKSLGEVSFAFLNAKELGDGRVQLIYPKTTNFSFRGTEAAPLIKGAMSTGTINHVISGSAEARQHDYSAANVDLQMSADDDSFTMTLTQKNLSGTTIHSGDEIRHFSGNAQMDKMTLAYSVADKNGTMSSDGSYNDFKISYEMDAVSEATLNELLNGKRNMSLAYSLGSGTTRSDINMTDMKMIMDIAMGPADFDASVSNGIAKMTGIGSDADYTVTMTELPFPPFQMQVDRYEMNVQAPLKKTDAPLPARYMFDLSGLKLSDTIWGMFDSTGSLSRDKAKLTIDISAGVRWRVDLQDISKALGQPGEVHDVTINDITLEIAGVKLHGTGGAVIDNSKFPPEPIGAIDVDLKGGIGLLDKLVALGLVPKEQGQMVKMFSGMFTLPGGAGDDHLTSKVEMKEGGAILVNGQQVK